MQPSTKLWIVYCIGIGLALFYKWQRCIRYERNAGQSVGQATWDWFLDKGKDNKASWTGTLLNVLGALVIGAVFIDKINIGLDWFQSLPVHWTLVLFLGYISEFLVPKLAKWIASHIPGEP